MKAKNFTIMMALIIAALICLAMLQSCAGLKYNGGVMSHRNPYYHIINTQAPAGPCRRW